MELQNHGRLAGGRKSLPALLLTAICAFILIGVLIAGLWPFHSPRNEVSWLAGGHGILFGKYGSVVSAGPFRTGEQSGRSCSIEIWLEPSRADASGTILAYYSPGDQAAPFVLRQSLGDLVIQRNHSGGRNKIYIDNLLNHVEPIFTTISSGDAGTTVYVNGTVVKKVPGFAFTNHDLTGRLVLGNAPATTHNWPGQLKSLTIYDHELSAAEASRDFENRTNITSAGNSNSDGVVARYLFDEGKGSVVHNQVDPGTDLLIPERFFVLHEQFLERPWHEYRSDWAYWKDVLINVCGFVPLGFFFNVYLSAIGRIKRSSWITIALGFSISLTIEVSQSFLPTRDSGMTDLVTNTLGTILGVMLSVWIMKENWFERAGLAIHWMGSSGND